MSRDLVILRADKDIEFTLRGLFRGPKRIGVAPIEPEFYRHEHRDPGCYHEGAEFLSRFARDTLHGLVVFDRKWQGAPSQKADELARIVEAKLKHHWRDRARCIVIDPEIESWMWVDSPTMESILGWGASSPRLRAWLEAEGLWPSGEAKPSDPKLAFEEAARAIRRKPSSALFRAIAEDVDPSGCTDHAFRRMVKILRRWFPVSGKGRGKSS